VDIPKPAVAEDAHHIAALDIPHDMIDNGIYIRQIGCGLSGHLQIVH
jgi:hypothetical protein